MKSLSILMPSIRLHKIQRVIDSVRKSFSGKWEIIIVSPSTPLPNLLQPEVYWVIDRGHMVRCQQLALIRAQYDYITRMTDDAVYLPGALDKAFELLPDKPDKTFVCMKMTEGSNPHPSMMTEDYYHPSFHDDLRNLEFLPQDMTLINYSLLPRQLIMDFGGWDCRFEQYAEADVDLAARMSKDGYKGIITPFKCVEAEWMPGQSGDHAPVHNAHFDHDLPLLKAIYNARGSEERTVVSLDNWRKESAVWERRFAN